MPSHFPNHVKVAFIVENFSTYEMDAVTDEHGSKMYLYDGFYVKLLSEALKFSISFVLTEEGFGKRTSDGNWTGLFGMLQREEADLSIDGIPITKERSQVADFSSPYLITDVTFLTHNSKPLPKKFTNLHVFDLRIWISIAAFFFIASVVFYILKRGKKSYQSILLRVFGSLLSQDLLLDFRSWPKKFIVLSWIVGVTFLSYSYKASILAFLSFPPLIGIRDIADVSKAVADGSHVCITVKGSFLIAELGKSHDPSIRVIGKSLMENSYRDFDALSFMKIEKPKTVIVAARADLTPYQNIYYLSRDSFFMSMSGVAVRKTFCCKKKLNEVVRRIFEAGLYDKFLRERDMKKFLKIRSYPVVYENTHILTLQDLMSTFSLLLAGHLLAATVFIVEYSFGKSLKRSVKCHCY